MPATRTEWWFQLVDLRSGKPLDIDDGQLLVLTAGAPTAPTVYATADGAAVTNAVRTPRTFTNGEARFWTNRSTTSVDLVVCITATGEAYFFEDVVPSDHKIWVDKSQAEYRLVAPFGASDNTEIDTGLDLGANCLIHDACIRVTTVDATETLDVGLLSSETGGDADGFLTVIPVDTLGYVEPAPTANNGANVDFLNSNNYGVLLASSITGSDAVATNGAYARLRFNTDGEPESLSYTGSAGSDTAAGYIQLSYTKLA